MHLLVRDVQHLAERRHLGNIVLDGRTREPDAVDGVPDECVHRDRVGVVPLGRRTRVNFIDNGN